MVILEKTSFRVQSSYHNTKYKIPVQIIFGQDIILPINHVSDWRCVRQHKHVQIEKDAIRNNSTRIDHNYRVGDQFMLRNKAAYNYETPFIGTYEIVHKCTNVTVTLQMVSVTSIMNICHIRLYHKLSVESLRIFKL